MAGVRVTPDQAQQKWLTRLSGASQDIINGVNNVQVAPGQLAAAQQKKWLTNVGVPRVSSGAQAKQAKFGAFAQQFFPHLEAGIQKVKAMPSTTLDDNI